MVQIIRARLLGRVALGRADGAGSRFFGTSGAFWRHLVQGDNMPASVIFWLSLCILQALPAQKDSVGFPTPPCVSEREELFVTF
jgi:hypothetical protein